MIKYCENCGRDFIATRKSDKFCSSECAKVGYYKRPLREDNLPSTMAIRKFECKCCGREVFVFYPDDKRECFCTPFCEKKFWRDATRHKDHGRGSNIGMSGGMSLGSLKIREARDLR